MKKLLNVLGIVLMIIFSYSCEKKPVPPSLSTTTVTEISTTSSVSGGTITADGGAPVISRGVCWNTSDDPSIENSKTTENNDLLTFTSNIIQLSPNTLYYVRAYATNSAGIGYGKSILFKTLGDQPVSNTLNASDITINSASINGSVNPNHLSTTVIFEYGVSTSYGSITPAQESPLHDTYGDIPVKADLTELTPGTTYHFRIKAENSLGITLSNDLTFITLGQVPAATTQAATNLQYNTATFNGSVNPNYLSTTVLFEWGTSTSYGNSITPSQSLLTGSTSQNINADLTGLIPGTSYHFRVTATNELGTTNSDDLTFTTLSPLVDIDGNAYNIRTIGNQVWMTENLKTTKYRNGDLIGTTYPSTLDISGETNAKYQWVYNGDESNVATYGRLYTWYTVTDIRNVCPASWHIPTDAEMIALKNYLTNNGYGYEGSGSDIGKSMAATSGWDTDSTPGNVGNDQASNNSSGFTAVPGGYRGDSYFSNAGKEGYLWTSTEDDAPYNVLYARVILIGSYFGNAGWGSLQKDTGLSVRCLKD